MNFDIRESLLFDFSGLIDDSNFVIDSKFEICKDEYPSNHIPQPWLQGKHKSQADDGTALENLNNINTFCGSETNQNNKQESQVTENSKAFFIDT